MTVINEDGAGVRCSCPGYAYRQSCRHLARPGHPAFRAAWSLLLEAGTDTNEIKRLWRKATNERRHPSAAAVRFAYLASVELRG